MNSIQEYKIRKQLEDVISVYEAMCDDLLKENSKNYKKDHVDLKEMGYEYRLELDKILIETSVD